MPARPEPFDDPGTCRCLIDLELAETPDDVATAWAWLMHKYRDAAFVLCLIRAWTASGPGNPNAGRPQ